MNVPRWLKSQERRTAEVTQTSHHVVIIELSLCHRRLHLWIRVSKWKRFRARDLYSQNKSRDRFSEEVREHPDQMFGYGNLRSLHQITESGSDLGSGQFHFLVILFSHFDMVAEQVRKTIIWRIQLVRQLVAQRLTHHRWRSRHHQESKGGFKWNFHQRRSRCQYVRSWSTPQSKSTSINSFNGVKPSLVEWSEEVIAFLAGTDYQEFILLLTAAASSKDVIRADIMFTGILSDTIEEIKRKDDDQVKKEADRANAQAENKLQEVQELTKEIQDIVTEHTALKGKLEQQLSALLKADFFLRYTLLRATSGGPNVMVRRIARTSNSGSGAVTGLEIWRQMTIHFAGSAKTRTVTLLKQIM